MLKITSLSECTFQQALTVWNEGFQGYFADMTFTMDRFMSRFAQEGLSPEVSVVAWMNERPVGFILNGVRTVGGKRIAWNGGTGVVPEYRRHGIGRRMIEACLEVYRAHDVDIAYLEAIAQNTPAIALYEQVGYRIVDRVKFLSRTGPLSDEAFGSSDSPGHTVVTGLPHEVARLPFYRAFAAWQTQWQSVIGGRSAILFDSTGSPVAYALYKQGLNERGEIATIALHQCEVHPSAPDKDGAIRRLLREVYAPLSMDCRRYTVNIPTSNEVLVRALEAEGFTTLTEQVFMMRDMKG
jgi:ribosomal protein S18 acetylase RimI-like enzyme